MVCRDPLGTCGGGRRPSGKGIQTLIGIMVGSDLEPIAAVADSVFECETGAELFVRHLAPDLADKTG